MTAPIPERNGAPSSPSATVTILAATKQQRGLAALPQSILHIILSHLHSSSCMSLFSLALTCRQLAAVARQWLFATVSLKSSTDSKDVSRLREFDRLLSANPALAEGTERLRLELGDGHRWIFSTILTPPFRTEDPASYNELRRRRVDLDRVVSHILLNISRPNGDTAMQVHGRSLLILELANYTFYPITPDPELMRGWQSVLGMATLQVLRISDVLDFPLALLGYAGQGVQEVGFLRVKLDRRDTEQLLSRDGLGSFQSHVTKSGKCKTFKPRVLSIRDCYPETIDPIVVCATNTSSFMDLSEVEELTVHPCLEVQASSYNKLVNTVITLSPVLTHLTFMASAQHQVNDLDALSTADFTRFKKVDLVFDEGFSGFPQLITDLRDLLRAASNVYRTAPPSPNPRGSSTSYFTGSSETADSLLVPGIDKKQWVASSLEELSLRFDLENLTMQFRPESTMSCPDPATDMQYHQEDGDVHHSATTNLQESVYYSHIKYIWRLDERDMEVLKEIDGMLSGVSAHEGEHTDGLLGSTTQHAFPCFKRLTTTCTFNQRSSFLLDEGSARKVYEICKEFVQRGLPRLNGKGILHFGFNKV